MTSELRRPLLDAVPVKDALFEALQPVLRDARMSGAPVPEVRDEEWHDDPQFASAMPWSRDGSGSGVNVSLTASPADRVARAADQVQEWVVVQLWARSAPTNWAVVPRASPGSSVEPGEPGRCRRVGVPKQRVSGRAGGLVGGSYRRPLMVENDSQVLEPTLLLGDDQQCGVGKAVDAGRQRTAPARRRSPRRST